MLGVKSWPHQRCPAVRGSYEAVVRQKIGRECSGSGDRGWHWQLAGTADRETVRESPGTGLPRDFLWTRVLPAKKFLAFSNLKSNKPRARKARRKMRSFIAPIPESARNKPPKTKRCKLLREKKESKLGHGVSERFCSISASACFICCLF